MSKGAELTRDHGSRTTLAVPLLGAAALIVAVLLPTHSIASPARALLAILGLIAVPGWVVVRYGSRAQHRTTVIAESIVVSSMFYVVGAFLLSECGVRLSTAWYLVIPIVGGAIAVALTRGATGADALSSPSVLTSVLVVCALASAGITHLTLPAPTPESSYSLAVPYVHLLNDQHELRFPVDIRRVRDSRSIRLVVKIDFIKVGEVTLGRASGRFNEVVTLVNTQPCRADLVALVGPQGQTLTPPVSCPGGVTKN